MRKINDNDPEPEFALAPIVLRRGDILGLWALRKERRKLIFFNYFRPPGPTTGHKLDAAHSVAALNEVLPRLREAVATGRTELADACSTAVRRIPSKPADLRQFRVSVLARDFGAGKTGQHGEPLLRPAVQKPYRQLLEAATELEKVQKSYTRQQERAKGTDPGRVQAEIEVILD